MGVKILPPPRGETGNGRIFTGSGVGIDRGSASVLGRMGLLGEASLGRGGDKVYVNGSTGNLVIERQDEVLIGRRPDQVYSLTYNSSVQFGANIPAGLLPRPRAQLIDPAAGAG